MTEHVPSTAPTFSSTLYLDTVAHTATSLSPEACVHNILADKAWS